MTGTVKWFNNQKGYGFIEKEDGVDVFVHYSGILGEGFKKLSHGQKVNFELEESEKGLRAVKVARADN